MSNRDPKGRFLPGHQSKGGMPKGTGMTEEYRKFLDARTPEVLEKVVRMAVSGDLKACRLVLERFYPAPTAAMLETERQIEELKDRLDEARQLRAVG